LGARFENEDLQLSIRGPSLSVFSTVSVGLPDTLLPVLVSVLSDLQPWSGKNRPLRGSCSFGTSALPLRRQAMTALRLHVQTALGTGSSSRRSRCSAAASSGSVS
jgi:hypothetical protein